MTAQSVYQQLELTAEHYADRPFLHIPATALPTENDFDASYQEVLFRTRQLKRQYQQSGLRAGDRVALLLENRPGFFFHWFALNGLGVCVVPINGELSIDEASYLLANSDVHCVVTLAEKLHYISEVIAAAGRSIPVVVDTKIDQLELPETGAQAETIGLNTECAILYTSGSTDKPKGCILSNEYFLSGGETYCNTGGYCRLESGKERLITPLPLVHMNAMACSSMAMMISGGCLIQLDRFHPRQWWKTVRESKATIIHYLGVMPAILLKLAEQDDDFSTQVKFGYGAGINPLHHAAFEQRFGFPLIESWGMTETGNTNCISAHSDPRHIGTSCIGSKPDALEIKLVDEAGELVDVGEPGELLLRASGANPRRGFFSGYYNNSQATLDAWQGGWFHTGDLVCQWEDGSFHFVDRLKNVIRRSGENISALQVEAVLSQCQGVAQVGVTAVADEIRGDEVMANIVLNDNAEPDQVTAEQIFIEAKKSLAYFKLPAYVAFVNALPLTPSNKPQRAELKKMAAEIVGYGNTTAPCFDLRDMKKK